MTISVETESTKMMTRANELLQHTAPHNSTLQRTAAHVPIHVTISVKTESTKMMTRANELVIIGCT